MGKKVKVTLDNIFCNRVGSDPGDHLEIRGILYAKQVFSHGAEQVTELWREANNHGVEIAESSKYDIQRTTTFTLANPLESLSIGGHLKEDNDFSSDDYFGRHWSTVRYDEIDSTPTSHSVYFPDNESRPDQAVTVYYTVQEIPSYLP